MYSYPPPTHTEQIMRKRGDSVGANQIVVLLSGFESGISLTNGQVKSQSGFPSGDGDRP